MTEKEIHPHKFCRRNATDREGATMVLIVILLPVLFALSAFAINVSQMESMNTEIQIASDAAARAAGRTYALTGDKNAAFAAAQEAATQNSIDGFVLPIAMSDLEFGHSTRTSESDPYSFNPTGSGNAVRLTTASFAGGAGDAIQPVFPFFGSAFEIRPERTAVSTQGVIDIALIVDRSGSMAYSSAEVAAYPPAPSAAPSGWGFGDPVPPNARWLDLIASVNMFSSHLNTTPNTELLSLTMYNHESSTPVQLTSNYASVATSLTNVSVSFDEGGTNIGGGMLDGLNAVNSPTHSRSHASKVIVLMTDGVHNHGTSPDSAANNVANAGVTLFAITFSDEADQVLMNQVANKCGGEHFHAVTAAQLNAAFVDIARRLPTLLTK